MNRLSSCITTNPLQQVDLCNCSQDNQVRYVLREMNVEILRRKNVSIIIREDRDSNAVCIRRDNIKEKTTAKGKEKTNPMSAHNENVGVAVFISIMFIPITNFDHVYSDH
ncbi:hypothetical protein Dimus_038112 [Dionaea muscipula]